MNKKKLAKYIGKEYYLRPKAQRESEDGSCEEIDDYWRLLDLEGSQVRLSNVRTGHQKDIGLDNFKEFRSPNFLLLRCHLILKGNEVKIEPFHESWGTRDNPASKPTPPKVRRIKQNIPSHLPRLTSGQQLLDVLGGACAFDFQYDEPLQETETELVSGFAQQVEDWGDISPELPAGQRVETAFTLGTLIKNLEEVGFWVFGYREIAVLEDGVEPPSDWSIAHIRVVRATNPEISPLPHESA